MTPYRIFVLLAVAGLLLSCDKEDKEPRAVIPVAPNLLAATSITQNTIDLAWNDRSDNEESFELEMGISGQFHFHTSLNADITTFTVDGLVPSTEYQFVVYAVNSAGRSEPSNILTVRTDSEELPPAPLDVTATALAPTVVRVEWSDTSPNAVNFVIDRRTGSVGWSRVGQVGDNVESFNDSSCAAESHYYYRVGTLSGELIGWSVDSAEVTTPALGTPQAPSNLTATVIVGTGVRLNWQDNSLDEVELHVRRNEAGQFWAIVDTLAPNTIEYFDSLQESVAIYNYQVRASNTFGVSAWSNVVQADYRYCSSGAVPICLSNFWTYEVNPETGPNYLARREIRQVDYPGGVDYYLLVEFVEEEAESLYYWRNFVNGLFQTDYPLGMPAELLLRTPPSGGFWNFDGDSVIVATSNVNVNIQGTVYSGVTIYQRFDRGSNRSIKYYLKPLTIGIIKEEYIEGSTTVVSFELVDYDIRN